MMDGSLDLMNAWMYLLDELEEVYKILKEQIREELNI